MGLLTGKVYPFWGSDQPQLFDLLSRVTDPDGAVPDVVSELCPPGGHTVLDVGAGFGKYAAWFARRGAAVVAVEPNAVLWREARRRLRALPEIRVLRAGAERLPLKAQSVDHAVAFWAYFFGSGDRGLREVWRVLRPGGCLAVVQNAGGDELSELWDARESECELWWDWFAARGFARRFVDTEWRFGNLDEATALLTHLFPARADAWLADRGAKALRIGFRVAVYYRVKEE
jgi:SAM-dependent methyltransferase